MDTKQEHHDMKEYLSSRQGYELRLDCREEMKASSFHNISNIIESVERPLDEDGGGAKGAPLPAPMIGKYPDVVRQQP